VTTTELPVPSNMAHLPRDRRGYIVPWFVAWLDVVDEYGTTRRQPDFRVIDNRRLIEAMQLGRCWLCGTQRGRFQSYVIGPMCAINRVSGEPGSHLACAEYAVRACPFMVNPDRHRGEAHIPEGAYMSEYHNPANPGVNLIWTSRNGHPMRAPDGNVLFDIGHPEHVEWYCRGRPATHTESMNALLRGAAFLREQAQQEGDDARLALEAQIPVAMRLVPDA